MQKTIWPINLYDDDEMVVTVPGGTTPLWVEEADGELLIWTEVDPSTPRESRRFLVFGPYATLPAERLLYVGSARRASTKAVCHIYEDLSARHPMTTYED